MSYLEMNAVSVGYGRGAARTVVLEDATLSVEENEFVAVIGFSGAGKSTLMALLAGLIRPDEGEVRLGGEPVTGPGPQLGIMFQNYSLLPWLSVMGNVELAVSRVMPNLKRAERREHALQYIRMVSLGGSEWKKPRELSGGMRQRLSLARTLSMHPRILLLDEPLSALDAITRESLQDEIVNIWRGDRRTVVMVTNDVDEALVMADRIVVLTPGPGAKLGESFAVDLPRPRDRAMLNHDARFKRLRNRVTRYLLDLREDAKRMKITAVPRLPGLEPIDLSAA